MDCPRGDRERVRAWDYGRADRRIKSTCRGY